MIQSIVQSTGPERVSALRRQIRPEPMEVGPGGQLSWGSANPTRGFRIARYKQPRGIHSALTGLRSESARRKRN
jgi:hypothetical protein